MSSSDVPSQVTNAVAEFQAALKDRKELKALLMQECTLQDVQHTLHSIEESQASKGQLRNMRRIAIFIERMDQLGQMVQVFNNFHGTMSFIWGSIKFQLLAASSFLEAWDFLLEMYFGIGNTIPDLIPYRKLLDKNPNIRFHLENYYCEVLEFHRLFLLIFSSRLWKQLFGVLRVNFESKYKEILARLKGHYDLLSQMKIDLVLDEVRNLVQSGRPAEDGLHELSREIRRVHFWDDENSQLKQKQHYEEKLQFVLSKLDAPDYHVDLEENLRYRKGGNYGDWILDDDKFCYWRKLAGAQVQDKKSLYLTGVPGAGKTILTCRIIEHLYHLQNTDQSIKVAFFFFKHSHPDKQTFTAFLVSILSQLVKQDEVVLDLVYRRLAALDYQNLKSTSTVRELAELAITPPSSYFILVDGLNECREQPPVERGYSAQAEIIEWIEFLGSEEKDQRLRILISGQRDGFLDKRLAHYPIIQLERVNGHTTDLEVYADLRTREIQRKFNIQDQQRLDIANRVALEAHGMFFYAKIVLDNLLNQSSRGHFMRELKKGKFPNGLEHVYEQVVVHVLEHRIETEREAAIRILGLVICSARPLLWKEIQAFFCIDVATGTVEPDYQLLESAKYYCGSLIETTRVEGSTQPSDDIVHVVHESARIYLLRTGRFNLAKLHEEMAFFCAKYLSSRPFRLTKDDPEIVDHCNAGYYSAMDYAAANWWKHARYLLRMPNSSDEGRNNALQAVYGAAQALKEAKSTQVQDSRGRVTPKAHLPIETQIRELATDDPRAWEDQFPVKQLIQPYRDCLEEIMAKDGFDSHGSRDPSNAMLLYGALRFKCTNPWCKFFHDGFDTAEARNEHAKRDCHSGLQTSEDRSDKPSDEIPDKNLAIPYGLAASLMSTVQSDSGYNTMSNNQSHFGKVVAGEEGNPSEIGQDDTKTVYSDTSSFSTILEGYGSLLAEDIAGKLGISMLAPEVVERLCVKLPCLLRALAFNIGFQAPTQMQRDIMVFLHRYRNTITESFKQICTNTHVQEPGVSGPIVNELTQDQGSSKKTGMIEHAQKASPVKIESWLQELQSTYEEGSNNLGPVMDEPPSPISLGIGNYFDHVTEAEEIQQLELPRLQQYTKLVFSDTGYEWLVENLRRELVLSRPEDDVMEEIRVRILGAIPRTHRLSRQISAESHHVVFEVDWNPVEFLDKQDYEESHTTAILNAITLTGSSFNLQALSCQDYMTQTWPRSGKLILETLQKLLEQGQEGTVKCNPWNGLTISAALVRSKLVVEAWGLAELIAEVGEQLAWLGAALRPGPEFPFEVVYCTPFVDSIEPFRNEEEETSSFRCVLKFRFAKCEAVSRAELNGQCWQGFFNHPVIVRGFPIPQRSQLDNAGLEIPLNMMTALTGTAYIDKFGSHFFIKGFSTMLVPTKRHDNLLVWHHIYSRTPGQRISYLDCNTELITNITISDLLSCRHIVGWCAEAISNVGSANAIYKIKDSGLPIAGPSHGLEKFEVSAGQFVTATAVFAIGNREKPVHISRARWYQDKLQWISSKRLVFWDEDDKRAWLVNGASALLHLLRASLTFSKSKFPATFLLDPLNLGDSPFDQTRHDSALDTLNDPRFRSLILYANGRTDVYEEETRAAGNSTKTDIVQKTVTYGYRVEDRVEQLYNVLEKLIDHQVDVERTDGLRVRPRARRYLHGWEFKDIVMDGDPFLPRVCTLDALGKGWVDLVRAIHAVAIFGRGFGELIQPKSTSATALIPSPTAGMSLSPLNSGSPGCPEWSRLPKGKFYLAARIMDMQQIMDHDEDEFQSPLKLCHNLLWYMKAKTFHDCTCTTSGTTKHSDPVQSLFPPSFARLLTPKPKVTVQACGAVIFGHNKSIPYFWPDHGDPERGGPASVSSVPSLRRGLLSTTTPPLHPASPSASTTTATTATDNTAEATEATEATRSLTLPSMGTGSETRRGVNSGAGGSEDNSKRKRDLQDVVFSVAKKFRRP